MQEVCIAIGEVQAVGVGLSINSKVGTWSYTRPGRSRWKSAGAPRRRRVVDSDGDGDVSGLTERAEFSPDFSSDHEAELVVFCSVGLGEKKEAWHVLYPWQVVA
jgi:hypothetical protein